MFILKELLKFSLFSLKESNVNWKDENLVIVNKHLICCTITQTGFVRTFRVDQKLSITIESI